MMKCDHQASPSLDWLVEHHTNVFCAETVSEPHGYNWPRTLPVLYVEVIQSHILRWREAAQTISAGWVAQQAILQVRRHKRGVPSFFVNSWEGIVIAWIRRPWYFKAHHTNFFLHQDQLVHLFSLWKHKA